MDVDSGDIGSDGMHVLHLSVRVKIPEDMRRAAQLQNLLYEGSFTFIQVVL